MEIKSAATFAPGFIDGLAYLNGLQKKSSGQVIYGELGSFAFKGYEIVSWKEI
jgi:hypothetical protein